MASALDVVDGEVRELIRRRGLDPFTDPGPESVVRDVRDRVAGYGPLQRWLHDPEVEETWVDETVVVSVLVRALLHCLGPQLVRGVRQDVLQHRGGCISGPVLADAPSDGWPTLWRRRPLPPAVPPRTVTRRRGAGPSGPQVLLEILMAQRSFAAIRGAAAAAVITAVLGNGVSPALAAPPTIETFPIQATFVDGFLSEACGVKVMSTISGRARVRIFDGRDKGLQELFTINVSVTLTAADNTFRLRDVGSDSIRITPDGTAILSIRGQIPFGFNGVMKINLDTGEVIKEPKINTRDLERACAALTA